MYLLLYMLLVHIMYLHVLIMLVVQVSLLEVLFSKYDMRDCLNEADNEGATPLHYTTLLGGTVLEYLLSKVRMSTV